MATATPSLVEVRKVDCRKGRGLYATAHIKEGDKIFSERPLVSAQFSWNEAYRYAACEYCLRCMEKAQDMAQRLTDDESLVLPHPECCSVDTSTFVPCPECQVMYCSEDCRKAAWDSYHQALCLGASRNDESHHMNRLLEIWREMHYPPETATIMLLAKMSAMVKQSSEPGAMLQKFSQFVHTTVNENEDIVHKLLGAKFKSELVVLRTTSARTLGHDHIQHWFTPEGFKSMFALIGTNGQGIGSSSISTWVKNCEALNLTPPERVELDVFIDKLYNSLDDISGEFLNCDGSGLYELQSSCNHSCEPNAEVNFLDGDHTLTLTAVRDIQPEEEITISYLDECMREHSRHTRQKVLRENYLFTCQCPRCQEQADDPDVTSEEEMSDEEEETVSAIEMD